MEQNKQLTNKKGVFINMREYYTLCNEDPFSVLPLTFLVKTGVNDQEFLRFQQYFLDIQSRSKLLETKKQMALDKRLRELEKIKSSQRGCKKKDGVK